MPKLFWGNLFRDWMKGPPLEGLRPIDRCVAKKNRPACKPILAFHRQLDWSTEATHSKPNQRPPVFPNAARDQLLQGFDKHRPEFLESQRSRHRWNHPCQSHRPRQRSGLHTCPSVERRLEELVFLLELRANKPIGTIDNVVVPILIQITDGDSFGVIGRRQLLREKPMQLP